MSGERATITLYFDPASYAQEAHEPLTDAQLQRFGKQMGEDAASMMGFEAWKADMPGAALHAEIKAALEGDSNDAEHDALVSVADALGIDYTPEGGI